jgi:hypothetical protein
MFQFSKFETNETGSPSSHFQKWLDNKSKSAGVI